MCAIPMSGEEINCDEYGRIKVQFFWDRHGQADDKTSCWLRVASSWAGDGYGGIAIPRIGMEVLVTFLEGDPHQPPGPRLSLPPPPPKPAREIHLKAGQKMVIQPGPELPLKAGGSFIKLDPGGITLSGPLAKINAGGSPGKGSGIKIKPPVLPGATDSDKAGDVLEQAQGNELLSTPTKRKRMLNFSG